MRWLFFVSILLSILVIVVSCKESEPKTFETQQLLHIAHTRTAKNDSLIQNLREKDFSTYDYLLLGGRHGNQYFPRRKGEDDL